MWTDTADHLVMLPRMTFYELQIAAILSSLTKHRVQQIARKIFITMDNAQMTYVKFTSRPRAKLNASNCYLKGA